jgi:hypothetical protein
MKLLIAPLLLSPVFASKAGKLAKFPKAKAPKSSAYGSMSASMSVGPEPPVTPSPTQQEPSPAPTSEPSLAPSSEPSLAPTITTVTACGETFTNTKVVLADNLDCGARPPDQPQDLCAVTLSGSEAEIDCNDFTLSQVATPSNYLDGPYENGICLINGAVARNCNVEKFNAGLYVVNGGVVRSSFLTSNYNGMYAQFSKASTVTIEDT